MLRCRQRLLQHHRALLIPPRRCSPQPLSSLHRARTVLQDYRPHRLKRQIQSRKPRIQRRLHHQDPDRILHLRPSSPRHGRSHHRHAHHTRDAHRPDTPRQLRRHLPQLQRSEHAAPDRRLRTMSTMPAHIRHEQPRHHIKRRSRTRPLSPLLYIQPHHAASHSQQPLKANHTPKTQKNCNKFGKYK